MLSVGGQRPCQVLGDGWRPCCVWREVEAMLAVRVEAMLSVQIK